jgi:hypothetical protein
MLSVLGTYSLGLSQPSTIDLNFIDTARFTLPSEAERPVFVPVSSIVTTSGAVSSNEARKSAAFSRVAKLQSDLRSVAKQLTIQFTPPGKWLPFSLDMAYTLSSQRSQNRGFSGSTAGDPSSVDWSRGNYDARHQFTINVSKYSSRFLASLYLRVQSGMAYTPMVGGDINGDGYANDRAFIFDPAHADDPTLANDMRTLIDGAPGAAQDCLVQQLGHIAGRNSCVGPWTESMGGRLGISGRVFHLSPRWWFYMYLTNPLGGLDQLLHGQNHLHGWGTVPYPDATLLIPRGFDSDTRRFVYSVNPRFGDTRPSRTTFRAPFQISLSASIRLGPDIETQRFRDLIDRGLTVEQVKRSYVVGYRYLFQTVTDMRDSLLLTKTQVEGINAMKAEFLARADSLLTPLAEHLVHLKKPYDEDEEIRHIRETTQAVAKLLTSFGPRLETVLGPSAWAALPNYLQRAFTPGASDRPSF